MNVQSLAVDVLLSLGAAAGLTYAVVAVRRYRLVMLAQSIAERAHAGQLDKAGQPYILHPAAVASYVHGWKLKIVAYLHDVLEDTPATEAELRAMFPADCIDTVVALTHRKNEPRKVYRARVKQDPMALPVKLADNRHNSLPERLAQVPEMDRPRLVRKYAEDYADLTSEEES